MGEFLREQLSTNEGTRDFARSLGTHGPGAAEEFSRWYAHLAQAKDGGADRGALKHDLATLRHFGEPLLERTYDEIARTSAMDDIAASVAVKYLLRRLDTRPSSLWELACAHYQQLFDVARAEELFAGAADNLHPTDAHAQIWWAAYQGDRDRLQALLVDPLLPRKTRLDLVSQMARMSGVPDSLVDQTYRRLREESPGDYAVVGEYAQHCLDAGHTSEAKDLLTGWLVRSDRSTGAFDEILARTQLALAYEALGDDARALESVAPAAQSQQFSALERTAILCERLGRKAEAESLAILSWMRYPDSPRAMALVVRELWKGGHYDKAAEVLARTPYPISLDTWRWNLGSGFADLFVGHPREGAWAARAIAKRGLTVGRHLNELALAVSKAGNDQLAFEMYKMVPASGLEALNWRILAYGCLRRSRGLEAARKWFAHSVPRPNDMQRVAIATLAYGAKEDTLLWAIPDPRPGNQNAEYFWLARTAAEIRRPSGDPLRRAAIERHYEHPWACRYATLGLYLIGRADESQAFAEATDARAEGEVDYFVGLRAQSEGRYRDAARMYYRCVATRQTMNAEFDWSLSQLLIWQRNGESLDRQAQAEGASRPQAPRS